MVWNRWMHRSIWGCHKAVYHIVPAAFEGWSKAERGRWRAYGTGSGGGGGIHVSETTMVQLGWHMDTILLCMCCFFFFFFNKPNHPLRFKTYRKEHTRENLVMWSTEIEGNYVSVKTFSFLPYSSLLSFFPSLFSNSGKVSLHFDFVSGCSNCSFLPSSLLELRTTSSPPPPPPPCFIQLCYFYNEPTGV